MQVNVLNNEGDKLTLELVLPVDVVKTEYQQAFDRIASRVRIDGFRKGHVPKNVILQRYDSTLQQDTLEHLFDRGMKDLERKIVELGFALKKGTVPVVSKLDRINPDSEFKFSCDFDVVTKLNLADAKAINFEAIKTELTDHDFDLTLDSLRQQGATVEDDPEGTIAAENCEATIDFVGTRDGVAFNGGTAQDVKIVMGQTRMIPGFCEQLVGHKVGDQFEIECTFPEDYTAEELRGAHAKFAITVKKLGTVKLPEIDDAFIAKYGFEGKSVEDFREDLKKQLLLQAELQSYNYNLSHLLNLLAEHFGVDNFKPTQGNIDHVASDLIIKNFFNGKKISKKEEGILKSILPYGRAQVLTSLFNQELFTALSISDGFKVEPPSEDEINAFIEQRSIFYDEPEKYKDEVLKDKESKQQVENACYERKLYQALCALVTVSEKVVSFEETTKLIREDEVATNNRAVALAQKWYEDAQPKAEAEAEPAAETAAETAAAEPQA